jgi:hypothetical protein
VQREFEAIPVADDDRAVVVTLGGSRVEAEVGLVEKLTAASVPDRQAKMRQVHDTHAKDTDWQCQSD